VILRHSLLRADIAEDIQLLFVFSSHTFFLSGWVVETREFCGTEVPSVPLCIAHNAACVNQIKDVDPPLLFAVQDRV